MRIRAVIIVITLVTLLCSCDKGDPTLVVLPDPSDPVPNTAPLVTVLYDPNALGDRSYNDLIYQGVEEAAQRYGLRTLQLSPQTAEEGEAYLSTLLTQLAIATDGVRRLAIIAGSSYDAMLRRSNWLLEKNKDTDLLYLETDTPLDGKGSTLFLPYYGAMYEAGAVSPLICSDILVIGSNTVDQPVHDAIEGFTDGHATNRFSSLDETINKPLTTVYLADQAGQGYIISDSTALRTIRRMETRPILMVPVCGGAAFTFQRLADITSGGYLYMGIDCATPSLLCAHSVVKHIDRAVTLCIGQWLTEKGMPKHQRLGLSEGYTEMVLHPVWDYADDYLKRTLTDEALEDLRQEAIRKEEEKYAE